MESVDNYCILHNLTLQEWAILAQSQQNEIEHLNRLLDQYIPLFYCLVVMVMGVLLFCCVLIGPARRRKRFTQAVGVKENEGYVNQTFDTFISEETNDEVILKVLPDYGETKVDGPKELSTTLQDPPSRKNTLQIPKISIDNVSIADSLYDELVFKIK